MSEAPIKVIATNRKARHDYHILDRYEAGMVLQGTEVKSLREGKVNMQDGFCTHKDGHMMLIGVHISPYTHGTHFNHDPRRDRILLLHRREIEKLRKASELKGYTLVPLKMYFKRGRAKVEIGVARGKKLYDKRQDIAERETKRRLDRIQREY